MNESESFKLKAALKAATMEAERIEDEADKIICRLEDGEEKGETAEACKQARAMQAKADAYREAARIIGAAYIEADRGEATEGDEAEALSRRLKSTRARLSLTLENVASITGLTYGTISRIEHGKAKPKPSTKKRIETALKSLERN